MAKEKERDAEDVYMEGAEIDPAIQEHSRLLRSNMSGFEAKIWKLAGKDSNPWGLLRQIPFGGYFLDFFSPEAMACVEADGPDHVRSPERDLERDKALRKQGIRTLRITPADLRRMRPMAILQMVGAFIECED